MSRFREALQAKPGVAPRTTWVSIHGFRYPWFACIQGFGSPVSMVLGIGGGGVPDKGDGVFIFVKHTANIFYTTNVQG